MMKFGLIGYPAAHSKSPELFAEYCGGKYSYDIIEEKDFGKAFRKFIDGGYKAVNVTAPFKTEAAGRADELSPEVEVIGAANILINEKGRIKALNSDFSAVSLIILNILKEFPEARSASVVGCGGAGRAAVVAAVEMGLKVTLSNRTTDSAEAFADNVAEAFGPKRRPKVVPFGTPLDADVVIYAVPNTGGCKPEVRTKFLIEANYLDPTFGECPEFRYISGVEWLRLQAETGFPIMTNP